MVIAICKVYYFIEESWSKRQEVRRNSCVALFFQLQSSNFIQLLHFSAIVNKLTFKFLRVIDGFIKIIKIF